MAYAFFRLPADASTALAAELNTFLRRHTIIEITREWKESGAGSGWAFCVEYVDGAASSATPSGSGMNGLPGAMAGKIDYRETLPPDQFAVYSRLREVRKAISEREGQPVFAIFSNKHLADMVQTDCRSLEALQRIAGIGEGRVTKYGAEMVAALAALPAAPTGGPGR
jgi:superfamily II DNA helicase RecQ